MFTIKYNFHSMFKFLKMLVSPTLKEPEFRSFQDIPQAMYDEKHVLNM